MAVDNQIDVGTLISEAIDLSYRRTSYLDYVEWATSRLVELHESYRTRGSILESIGGVSDALNHVPAVNKPDHHDYRAGYKAGWKRRKENGAATPPAERSSVYQSGFAHGYGIAEKAANTLNSFHAAVGHAEAGDHEKAQEHANVAAKHAMSLAAPYYGHMVKSARGAGKREGDDEDLVSQWMVGERRSKQHGFIRPMMLHHAVNAVNNIDQHLSNSDESDHEHHPADLAQSLARQMVDPSKWEEVEKARAAQRDVKAGIVRAGGKKRVDAGGIDPAQLPHINDYKNRLLTQVFGEGAVKGHLSGMAHHPGIDKYLKTPHEREEDPHQAARLHAHDMWMNHIIDRVAEAHQHANEEHPLRTAPWPKAEPHPDLPGVYHHPDKDDRSVKFNTLQYVKDRFADPAGWAGRGASLRAAQKQLGPGFTQTTFKKNDPASQALGVSKHPLNGKFTGVVKRLDTWMQQNIPQYHPEHPMWEHHRGIYGAKGGHTKRKGKAVVRSAEAKARDAEGRAARAGKVNYIRRQAESETLNFMFSLFENWLAENVELPEGELSSAMEDIYSRVQTTYGYLFESDEG